MEEERDESVVPDGQQVAAVEGGFSLVLNGGQREMNSATIPVRWFFSQEILEKEPEYILLFEQDAEEKEGDPLYRGRRYLVKVADAVKFLQFFSPGYHRVMAVALTKDAASAARYLFKLNKRDEYEAWMDWHHAMEGCAAISGYFSMQHVAAATVVEFEVPPELFAEKPRDFWGKLVWRWANLFFESPPTNECHYRRRLMFAFSLQPFCWMIRFFILYGIGGTCYAAYVFFASAFVFLCGFRPKPIIREVWDAWRLERERNWDVLRFRSWDPHISADNSNFRLWAIKGERFPYRCVYLPAPPIFLVVAAGAGLGIRWLIIWLLSLGLPWVLIALGGIVIVAFFFAGYLVAPIICKQFENYNKDARVEAAAEKAELRELYHRWLKENFDLSQKSLAVDIANLPVPMNKTGRMVQKFRVGFWTLKARVCRPYAGR